MIAIAIHLHLPSTVLVRRKIMPPLIDIGLNVSRNASNENCVKAFSFHDMVSP